MNLDHDLRAHPLDQAPRPHRRRPWWRPLLIIAALLIVGAIGCGALLLSAVYRVVLGHGF